jgi:hypothetical protein
MTEEVVSLRGVRSTTKQSIQRNANFVIERNAETKQSAIMNKNNFYFSNDALLLLLNIGLPRHFVSRNDAEDVFDSLKSYAGIVLKFVLMKLICFTIRTQAIRVT